MYGTYFMNMLFFISILLLMDDKIILLKYLVTIYWSNNLNLSSQLMSINHNKFICVVTGGRFHVRCWSLRLKNHIPWVGRDNSHIRCGSHWREHANRATISKATSCSGKLHLSTGVKYEKAQHKWFQVN